MVNWYIYAKDISGSTSGVTYYHNSGLETYYEFVKNTTYQINTHGSEEARICYLHWNVTCQEVKKQEVLRTYQSRYGCEGTELLPLVRWIKSHVVPGQDHIKLLYIITDGCVDRDSVNESAKESKDLHPENVLFYAFNLCTSEINLSIVVPFLHSKCKIYCNNGLQDESDLSEEYNYSAICVENFFSEMECLKSYIKLKFLVVASEKDALQEIKKLNSLRDRLFEEVNERDMGNVEEIPETRDATILLASLKQCKFYKDLFLEERSLKQNIDGHIATLRNYIECSKKSLRFDALRFDSKFNHRPAIIQPEETPLDQFSETIDQNYPSIEFPDIILLTEENKSVPVILLVTSNLPELLIKQGNISTSKFQSMLQCPLFFHNVEVLANSIGHYYTLPVFKALIDASSDDDRRDPLTRQPFHGGIIPLKEFDEYNDYILAATYFNSKLIQFNVGLFYYILYVHSEKKPWMDRNVVQLFKKYALQRISTTKCRLGLSSLPLDPLEQVSLPTALWYCAELSSYLFMNLPDHFQHERLRMFRGVAKHMINILIGLDYKIDETFVRNRSKLLAFVYKLSHDSNAEKKTICILNEIFQRDQHGFLTAQIKNAQNLRYLKLLDPSLKQPLHKNIVKQSLFEENPATMVLSDYVNFMYHEKDNVPLPALCKETLRPYFVVEDRKSFYRAFLRSYEEVHFDYENGFVTSQPKRIDFHKILSLFKLYINYVHHVEKYPSLEEYLNWVQRKTEMAGNRVNIFPIYCYEGITQIYNVYENLIKTDKISIEEFVLRACPSANRVTRITMENSELFPSLNDIQQFLLNEQAAVINT